MGLVGAQGDGAQASSGEASGEQLELAAPYFEVPSPSPLTLRVC